ncbi:MAG UNVERIFIED_CONTAM: hypothetical protein LVR29_13485 [Microcystis novacekii LVE1205-3]
MQPVMRSARLVRGGSWGDEARHLRSANRTFVYRKNAIASWVYESVADSTG